MIRPMAPSDLDMLVTIHLASFPGFFLTFLGQDFLALLYQNIQRDLDGIVLVAAGNDRIEGFVAGVTRQTGFYRRLVEKHKWAFASATLGAVLRRPTILPRVLRALRRPEDAQQAAAEACLMSIAVRPESQGRGIGKELVEAFCRELAERGAKAVCLTTDRDHNDGVNRFYQKLGFTVGRSYVTPEGRHMNEYVLSLGKE
jgi:ribosomal protein S18 acetylase RimI-like enzyme